MSYPFNGSLLSLSIDMNADISSATDFRIYYKKPYGGQSGYWAATRNGQSLEVTLSTGQIDQAGLWKFEGNWLNGGAPVWSCLTEQYVDRNLIS